VPSTRPVHEQSCATAAPASLLPAHDTTAPSRVRAGHNTLGPSAPQQRPTTSTRQAQHGVATARLQDGCAQAARPRCDAAAVQVPACQLPTTITRPAVQQQQQPATIQKQPLLRGAAHIDAAAAPSIGAAAERQCRSRSAPPHHGAECHGRHHHHHGLAFGVAPATTVR